MLSTVSRWSTYVALASGPNWHAVICSMESGCDASTAESMLEEMGLRAFAERARRELAATGATVRRRVAEARDDLTAQEREIARLARDGLSNPEIAGQLFLSPRTIEWHLRKVFSKLDIASRRELGEALSEDEISRVLPALPSAAVGVDGPRNLRQPAIA
jgi:DNA-binding NarL/FixJ family response regulator